MILKGQVSSIETNGVRVAFKEKDNSVSAPLKIASHISELKVGENVAVAFFSDNMVDGVIIARW